jgi:hypothetical protein
LALNFKKHAYFVKHADRDGEAEVEFDPEISEAFILYVICGRELCGEAQSEEESTFLWRLQIHHPSILTELGQKCLQTSYQSKNFRTFGAFLSVNFLKQCASRDGSQASE